MVEQDVRTRQNATLVSLLSFYFFRLCFVHVFIWGFAFASVSYVFFFGVSRKKEKDRSETNVAFYLVRTSYSTIECHSVE